ncbi:uncharacterized protein SCHCODRAFT_02107437 [Schizophyllum commune H4-8]|uniref:uncharacterized protein n=1 Tax=Schizophyllum commune (strain H4-8 / FGSC 9210) TaxID=578458 RepID=UPI00216064A7|nr:uncharacterized protein SCHCODRAFT_02107437 [Schizophyllum commune H4-8]KAI5885884.1 hypothetical protein SCHCODRAFT_02107437 [Schizophyllum commune H4-8]
MEWRHPRTSLSGLCGNGVVIGGPYRTRFHPHSSCPHVWRRGRLCWRARTLTPDAPASPLSRRPSPRPRHERRLHDREDYAPRLPAPTNEGGGDYAGMRRGASLTLIPLSRFLTWEVYNELSQMLATCKRCPRPSHPPPSTWGRRTRFSTTTSSGALFRAAHPMRPLPRHPSPSHLTTPHPHRPRCASSRRALYIISSESPAYRLFRPPHLSFSSCSIPPSPLPPSSFFLFAH